MSLIETILQALNRSSKQQKKQSDLNVSRLKDENDLVDEAVETYIDQHCEDGNRLTLDAEYWTTSNEGMSKIIESNKVNKEEYVS